MTRSVEIPEAAVGAFSEAYLLEVLSRVSTASLPSNSAVRAGLLAARPYLAPDADGLFIDRPLDPQDPGGEQESVKLSTPGPVSREMLDNPNPAAVDGLAPAGDGGLREALEKMLAEPRGTYDLSEDGRSYNQGVEQIRREVRGLLTTHPAATAVPQPAREDCNLCLGLGGIAPHLKWSEQRGKPLWTAHEYPSDDPHPTYPCPQCAVPQPVDREALLQVIAEHIDDLDDVPQIGTSAEHLERRAVHVTDAVLALFAGEKQPPQVY